MNRFALVAGAVYLALSTAPALADPCAHADAVSADAIDYYAGWADLGYDDAAIVVLLLDAADGLRHNGRADQAMIYYSTATHVGVNGRLGAARLNEVAAAAAECRDGHAADAIEDISLRAAQWYYGVSPDDIGGMAWPDGTDFTLFQLDPADSCITSGEFVYLSDGRHHWSANRGWTDVVGHSESWGVHFEGGGCLVAGTDIELRAGYDGRTLTFTIDRASAMMPLSTASHLVLFGVRLLKPNGKFLRSNGDALVDSNIGHQGWSLLSAEGDGDCIRDGDAIYLHRAFEFWNGREWFVFDGNNGRLTVHSDATGCLDVGDGVRLVDAGGRPLGFVGVFVME